MSCDPIRIPTLLLLLLFSFLCATNVHAQYNGIISGTITDELGEPIPGVSVELKGASPLKPATAFSDGDGNYVFQSVAPGNYQLAFRLLNFASVMKTIAITSDGSMDLDVAMHLTLDAEVVVTGKDSFRNLAERTDSLDNLIGVADAASVGVVTGQQVDQRPFLRAGEVLETVPGVVISQHSGQGKANQYYLRGFNLDHGTDFSISVNDIPVNMPTHGHGQGYADINFLIPELISVVQYKKGPYDAEEGDFAAAGAAHISYANSLPAYLAQATGGNFSYARGLLAGSPKLGSGNLLYGFEYSYDDGPWDNGDNFRKLNGVLRYSRLFAESAFSITGMGYEGKWDSTDQIPLRAVEDGEIGRFGNVDPTDGGKTHRYSLSTEWERNWSKSVTRASAYVMDYKLNLWSNFTYFLDDQVNGDQFEQADDRTVFGGKITHRFLNKLGNFDAENVVGLQFRNDDITGVGLFHTKARERLSTTRQDDVIETGTSIFFQNNMQWTDKVRTLVGIRGDFYRFKVDSNINFNSGTATKSLASPKFGLVLGPWKQNEFYFNYGWGFHSNDARGTTITVDPVTGEPADKVDPLVRAKGAEFGIRSGAVKNFQTTLALWLLDIDSELLFVGDAGITEPSRPSRRTGFEWSNYYRATPWLVLDADLAWSKARFRDFDPAGDRIPGAIEGVISAGATVDNLNRFFGTLRLRYWGPRPLIEDNSERSKSSTIFNARVGYKFMRQLNLYVDIFNIFNTDASDVDYFYASRLPGEPDQGVDDFHFHPSESRSFRVSLSTSF